MSIYAVYAHGDLPWDAEAAHWYRAAQVRLAADGGARALLRRGLLPDVAVGDWDSLSADELHRLRQAGVTLHTFPPDKDATDLELALLYAVEHGAHEIHVFGALGGRWDQTAANLLLLAHPRLREARVRLHHNGQRLWLIRGQDTITGAVGDTLSFVPLGGPARGVTLQGVAYPLENGALPWAGTLGVSNRFTQPQVQVQVREGMLLAVHIPQDAQRALEDAKQSSAP
ncbi:MAG: thiamine diphosphokinase [Chloroflexi bacterium]|nr:thiamine diphosphokinase [Chloroflexota bacterium]